MTDLQIPNWHFMLDKIYPDLKGSVRQAADLLRKQNDRLAAMSIVEIAEAADTSVSTIQRLCKAMGFKRFKDFKISLVQNAAGKGDSSQIEPGDDILVVKEKIFKNNIAALKNTARILDEQELAKAIAMLQEARGIELFAIGGSSALALDAMHKFLRIGIKCHCVSDVDHQSKHAVLLGPGDVVIAISYSGKSIPLLENLATAKERGASIIAITGYGKSPLSKLADAALYSCSAESGFWGDLISKRIAQLTIIDTLFLGLSLTDYERYSQNIHLTQGITERYKRKSPAE
ncbi:MAG: MurR/RpiR family transcriptional regulator [Deltaproteobacteria bacterium]|nr:MurR/RpiR family transcriptional regulator [Deltaproteobacteria bacterium]